MSHPPPYSYSILNDDDTNDEGMVELPELPQPAVPVMSRPYEPPIASTTSTNSTSDESALWTPHDAISYVYRGAA
jgi:hypothetical protein